MSSSVYAPCYQGAYITSAQPGYAWVSAGMSFVPLAGCSWGSLGVNDTVTAVTPDPNGNAGVMAPYPGDTVTLAVAGTVPASSLANAYLYQPGGYY